MTGFNFVAPETTDQNAPQIGQDLQQRRRAAAERSYAGPLPETPEQRNKNVMRAFNMARETDPSATRMARRMAQEANIPEDVALADPKFAESVLQQREMERRDLWNRNPTVARFMEDVEFAKIASDDLDSLVRTDGFLNAYWMGRQIKSGWQQTEQGEIWNNILSRGGKKTLGESFQLEEINRDLARQKDEEGLTGGIFNVAGQIANSTLYAAPAAWAGAKAGAAFGPGGAAVGAAVGGRLAVFARSAYVERGRKYGELRDLGLSHDEAEKSSLGYGLASGALEAVGWGFLSAPARKMILEGAAKKVSTALSQDLLKTARRKMLTDTAGSFGGELGTEWSQTIAGYFTDRWAIESSGLDVETKAETLEGLQSLSSQLGDTLIQTLKSIGPLSAVFPAIRLSRESRLARDAMRGSKLIQDIVETSGNSKLAEEAPESYARVLNEQAKAAGVETVYVDPETFEQVLNEADKADLATRAQEAGVSVEEMQKQVQQAGTGTRAVLDQKMPEVMSRVAEAKAAGEQLEIPMAKFNEVFRNTRVLALLVKHVKLQRTGRTAAQAQAFEEAKLQLKQEADKAIDENASEREKLLDGVDDLKAELMDSFNVAPKPEQATDAQGYPTQRGWQGMPMIKVEGEKAVPMSKEDANVAVEWVSNAAIVGAAEDKVSVREWWTANKFRVMQKLQPSAQAPAEQRPVAGAAQPASMQAAGRRVATWFSGTGTMEASLESPQSVQAVEFNPAYMDAFNKAHKTDHKARDVNSIDPQEVAAAKPDLFHASPVCKNFSAAKSSRTVEQSDIDSANAVARVITEAKPPIVTIENDPQYVDTVPYQAIVKALEDAGYNWDVGVYDAADYGGVQRRPRMLIRAMRDQKLPPLPEKTGGKDWFAALEDLIEDAPDSEFGTLTKDKNWEMERIDQMAAEGKIDKTKPILTMGGSAFKGQANAANAGNPAPVLKSTSREVPRIILPDGRVKRVTPRMMARLMGMPDSFPIPDNANVAKEVLGNGMSASLTQSFIQPMLDALPSTQQPDSLQAAGRRVVQTPPELTQAAQDLAAGKITRDQYDAAVVQYKPVRMFEAAAQPASVDAVTGAVNSVAKPKVTTPETIASGTEVGIRLDIPSQSKGVGVVTVHEKSSGFRAGKAMAYVSAVKLTNAKLGFAENAAFDIAQGEKKDTIGIIKGSYVASTAEDLYAQAQEAFKDPAWRQVGGDPERHSYFYDRETMQPVVSADEVIQIGGMVLAKNPVYADKGQFMYAGGQQNPQGAYFPRTNTIELYEAATLTTFLHEASHWWLTTLFARARAEGASSAVQKKMQMVFNALGVKDMEAWDALPIERKEALHEAFSYNFESYLLEGKAPTEEQRGLFATIARWTRRLYSNLRDTLAVTYEREYGEQLPMMSNELRQVFDRMTATEEQIEATELLRDLTPMFQTEQEALAAGMTPEEWLQFSANLDEAREAAFSRLATASLDQMKYLAGAISDKLASKQAEMSKERSKVRKEVESSVKLQKVYRVIRWLQTKIALDEQGNEFTPTLRNKIDVQEVVRYVMNGAIPNLKPPAKPSGSVRQDKDLLVQQEAKLEQLRASVTNAEARLEALRKEFKDLPRTPIEGLDQSQMLFQANKQMEDQRQEVNAAEAALAAFLPKVEEARQNYEKTRKKSKKTLLAEGMTEQQWEAEQADIDKQLPDEVKRVENLKASMQMVRDQLDSRGDKRTPQLKEKVEKFSKQLQEAEAVLKAAEDGYRQMSEKSKTVSEKDTKAFLKELAAEADKVKRAQTKVAQKRSNLAKARVDVEAAQKRPTYTGSERDKLQSNLRNFAAQRKTAEDNLQAARARVRNEIAGLGEKEYKKAKAEQKKLQEAVTKQQEKLAKIEDGLKLSRRQKAAVQIRSLHRGLQSERTRLREMEQRVSATEKRIELNEPTLQGPVLDKLASMLTKKDGVSLQEVAALWGIPGGGPELLRMLFEAPAMQDAIESQTDEIMLERFGDYQSAEAAEGVVADAMHEEARTKLVATELQWLQSQLQRMMEDLDPDMKAARKASAAQLQLAEEKAAALSEALQKARETAMQNPEMQQLTEQKTTARTLATDAVKKSRENPQDSALAADAATKSAALNDILTKIDAAWGPDVQMAVQELEKAKEQVRVSKAEGRRAYVPVSTLVSAARAVAEDVIDNMEVGKISSAKHQAEEGRMNQKVMDALSSKRVKDKKGQPRVFKALEAKRLQLVQHMKAKAARVAEKKIAEIKGRMKRLFQSPQENIAKNYNTELYNAARAVAALYGFGPEVAVARAAEQLQAVSRYNPQMWERIQQIINPQVLQARTTGDYKKLTYSQLQDVDVLIKGMLEIARAERIVELGDRTIAIEEAQRQLTDSLSKHPKPFAAMGVAQSATKLQKFLKFWSNVKAWMRGMEQWTVAVDGGRGAWWDLVYNPIKSQINAYSVQRNKLVERYARMLSELEVEQDPIKASEIGYTFKNTAELLGAILHMGNMSNYRKLLLGRNWGVEQLGQLDDSKWKLFIQRMHENNVLTKKHWDFAQGVWDMMEEIKPDLQKAHFKVFGYYFREVRYENIETPFGVYRGGYVPAKTDPMLVASHQSEENINEINGDMRSAVPAVQSGWANDRVEAYTKPLNLDLTMVLRHIDETVRFIHVQPTVQGVLRMIRPFEARNSALGAVDPEAYAELIIPWMVSAARQATSTRGSAFGTQVLDRLRRWSGMDALFGGVANAVGNLTAIPMAVRKLGVRAVMSGLRQYIVSSYSRAEGAERLSTWVTMQSPFMDNRTRGKMLEMAQMLDALVSNPGAYKKLKRMASKNAYFLQTFFQNISDMSIWKGAYDTYQDKHDVSAMTPEQIHAEAVKYADYMVRDNSPSLSPEDQAKLLKGGPFMRLMLQFGGYFNWLFNVNTTDFGNLIREVGLLRTPLTARFYQQLILGYAAPLFVADAIMQLFSGAFFDDEDDEELTSAIGEKVLVSVGRGTASMFPFVGQVSLALYGLTTEDPNDERITNAPAVNYIMRAGRGAVAAGREVGEALGLVDFEKEVTGREVRDMFGLLSIITGGLPTSVLGKPAQFITDVSNDRYDDPDFVQWTQGVMSGKASGASR